jgi:DNA polymerase-3 subunit delta'
MVFALPVGKSETKGDDPIEALSEEQLDAVHEQLRLKAESHYHRIEVPKATFIKINSVREVKRQSALSTFEEGRKVFLILNAEEMNEEASNSLLKTLEEPSRDTVFVLTTSERDKVLPTILSRCQHVQFDRLEESDMRDHLVSHHGVEQEQAELVAKLSDGNYARAYELLSVDIKSEREEAVQFMRSALSAKPLLIFLEVERLSASSNRPAVERSLRMLQVWLRDALLLQERGPSGNGHEHDDVCRFIEKFPKANLSSALESVEASIALLSKNVYLPLILTNLAIDLKKHSTVDSSV